MRVFDDSTPDCKIAVVESCYYRLTPTSVYRIDLHLATIYVARWSNSSWIEVEVTPTIRKRMVAYLRGIVVQKKNELHDAQELVKAARRQG